MPVSSEMTTPYPGPSSGVLLLGYGGLIPFVALAVASWVLDPAKSQWSQAVLFALIAYGATILSFLGAIHWGLSMSEKSGPPIMLMVWGVTPSLLAWVALLLAPIVGLSLLAMGLWLCFAVDRVVYPRFGVQAWLPMRLALTAVASLACLAAVLGLTR